MVDVVTSNGEDWKGKVYEVQDVVRPVRGDFDADEGYVSWQGSFVYPVNAGHPHVGGVEVQVLLAADQYQPDENSRWKTFNLQIELEEVNDWHEVQFAVSDWFFTKFVNAE